MMMNAYYWRRRMRRRSIVPRFYRSCFHYYYCYCSGGQSLRIYRRISCMSCILTADKACLCRHIMFNKEVGVYLDVCMCLSNGTSSSSWSPLGWRSPVATSVTSYPSVRHTRYPLHKPSSTLSEVLAPARTPLSLRARAMLPAEGCCCYRSSWASNPCPCGSAWAWAWASAWTLSAQMAFYRSINNPSISYHRYIHCTQTLLGYIHHRGRHALGRNGRYSSGRNS